MIPPLRKSKVYSALRRSLRQTKLKRTKGDAMVWLNFLLFMKTLATECQMEAVADKSKVITAHHVRCARKGSYQMLVWEDLVKGGGGHEGDSQS